MDTGPPMAGWHARISVPGAATACAAKPMRLVMLSVVLGLITLIRIARLPLLVFCHSTMIHPREARYCTPSGRTTPPAPDPTARWTAADGQGSRLLHSPGKYALIWQTMGGKRVPTQAEGPV